MANFVPLPKKEIEKVNKELLEIHKKVITNYLLQYHSMKLRSRKKFFIIYDYSISYKNIHRYFFAPIGIFVGYLIKGELSKIENYRVINKAKRKKK